MGARGWTRSTLAVAAPTLLDDLHISAKQYSWMSWASRWDSHKGDDAVNERLRDALNASGKMYLIHTKLGGRLVLRLAIGGTYTRRRHVERAWELIRETADRIFDPSLTPGGFS